MLPFSKDALKRKITATKNAVFLSLLFSPASFALTCVPVVGQWGTVSYITQNSLSCSATEWAVFTPADLSAYNATIAASASGVPAATTSATVSNVSASFTNGLITGGALVSVCLLAWGFSAVRRVLH